MADLGYNNKLLGEEEDDQQQGQTGATQNLSSGESSGLVSGGTGGVSTAGTGAGGTGSWTNIQSYLNANKGSTGSEKLVQDKMSSQFGTEKQNIQNSGTETKSQVDGQVAGVKDAAENGRKWVDEAAELYDWTGNNSGSAYTDKTGKVKQALTGQYQGPTSYDYAMGSDTQRYGEALKNDDGFGNVMNELYRDASGGQISRGGLDLQAQLDASNDQLASTRQNLLAEYAGLKDLRNQTAEDVGSYITDARETYGGYQNSLKDDLASYGNDRSTAISKAQADARKAFTDLYGSGNASGTLSGVNDQGRSWLDYQAGRGRDTLAEIQDFLNSPTMQSTLAHMRSNPGEYSDTDRQLAGFDSIFSNLDSFYGSQKDQYAGTGDLEKRQFNTIMDMLGLTNKEQQGYDVVQRSTNSRGQ